MITTTFKERFTFLGLFFLSLLYAVYFGILFMTTVLLFFLTPIDVPIYLLTGKTLVVSTIGKISNYMDTL
jgi:hypothetical protein